MMKYTKNIIGNRYGRLTVMLDCGVNKKGSKVYVTVCDCGESKAIVGSYMISGKTQSCGCLKRELTQSRMTTHGDTHSPTYVSWLSMRNRCLDSSHKAYANYGGKGIRIDDLWLDYCNFLKDMGSRPNGMTLDRIDNSKGYSKDNCRWATRAEQNRNYNKNVNVTYNGKTQCLKDWATEVGAEYKLFWQRFKSGWTIEQLLSKRY